MSNVSYGIIRCVCILHISSVLYESYDEKTLTSRLFLSQNRWIIHCPLVAASRVLSMFYFLPLPAGLSHYCLPRNTPLEIFFFPIFIVFCVFLHSFSIWWCFPKLQSIWPLWRKSRFSFLREKLNYNVYIIIKTPDL